MKLKTLTFFAALLCVTGPLQAQNFKSAFGFSSDISDNWLIVSRQTVSENPDLLNFETNEMQALDGNLLKRIKSMALSGQIELLYYKHSDANFNDNINLFVSNIARSDLASVEAPLCNNIQAEIRAAYNRTDNTEIYSCGRNRINSLELISYAFDGALVGSRSYGYLFNTNSGSVTLTITCKLSKCNEVVADAQSLFKNIRF